MPVYKNDTTERIYFNENNYVDPGKEVTVYDDLSSISGLTETSSEPDVIDESTISSDGWTLKFDTFNDFPTIGSENYIYVDEEENNLYTWDSDIEEYVLIGVSSLIYSGTESEPDTSGWSENTIYIQV